MLLFNNVLQKWPRGRAPVERSCLQWEVHGPESFFPRETGSVHYPNYPLPAKDPLLPPLSLTSAGNGGSGWGLRWLS